MKLVRNPFGKYLVRPTFIKNCFGWAFWIGPIGFVHYAKEYR